MARVATLLEFKAIRDRSDAASEPKRFAETSRNH
jgi:hypothetical protein